MRTKTKGSVVDPEMEKRIHAVMERTWQTIGYDCFSDENFGSMSKMEVIEVVLDADRCLQFGKDQEAALALYRLPYAQMISLAKKHFTERRYGL